MITHNPNGENKSRMSTRNAVIKKAESSKMGDVKYYHCHYCRTPLLRKNITVDHIIPISKGGSYSVSNLVVCCKGCNMRKGNTDYFEFIEKHTVA